MKPKAGFSLVELSIVLVILGLLVGGVLAGKSLIRASELRAVGTEWSRYRTAVSAFKDKYFALPGDMSNATAFWGTQDPTPATCKTTASTTALTCNGDGNGMVHYTLSASPGSNEIYRFWQHLANAGLIEGQFDGISHGSTASILNASVLGTNTPGSKLPGGGWTAWWVGNNAGTAARYAMSYGNIFFFGAYTVDNVTGGALLTPEEQWNIDKKLDDGTPGYGKIIAQRWDTCTTSTSFSDLDGVYDLAVTTPECSINFKQAF